MEEEYLKIIAKLVTGKRMPRGAEGMVLSGKWYTLEGHKGQEYVALGYLKQNIRAYELINKKLPNVCEMQLPLREKGTKKDIEYTIKFG